MYSIHEALEEEGWNSVALVGRKASTDAKILSYPTPTGRALHLTSKFLDQQYRRLVASDASASVTFNLLGSPLARMAARFDPSVVHVHWVGDSLITPQGIARLPEPTVWTLHDMWPFTGGCHHSWDCERYMETCGRCPIIGSSWSFDATRLEMKRRQRAWRKKTLHVVAISNWLADRARRSSLFAHREIDVILPGVDTFRFRPHDPAVARRLLSLPEKGAIVGFVAINPASRLKGWSYLRDALTILRDQATRNDESLPVLLRVGGVPREERRLPGVVPTFDLGFLSDDLSLALAYSACSVVAVPSVQEAFGRVAIEALACGTPVVAFRDTGVVDAVDHGRTGYLADFGSAPDLAHGLASCVNEGRKSMRVAARETAEKRFSTKVQARHYSDLYGRLLRRESQT